VNASALRKSAKTKRRRETVRRPAKLVGQLRGGQVGLEVRGVFCDMRRECVEIVLRRAARGLGRDLVQLGFVETEDTGSREAVITNIADLDALRGEQDGNVDRHGQRGGQRQGEDSHLEGEQGDRREQPELHPGQARAVEIGQALFQARAIVTQAQQGVNRIVERCQDGEGRDDQEDRRPSIQHHGAGYDTDVREEDRQQERGEKSQRGKGPQAGGAQVRRR